VSADGPGDTVLALLVCLALVAAAGALAPAPVTTPVPGGSVGAGLDNLLLPVAVVLTVRTALGAGIDRRRALRTACLLLVVGMCLNAVVACVSVATDLSPLLSHWWSNAPVVDLTADTVAGRASTLGRFSGIFNQPAEAGTMFAMALLAAGYLGRRSPVAASAAAALLTVGGVLTVSKIFLLVGLPVALWQVLGQATLRRLVPVTASVGLVLVANRAFGAEWSGQTYLTRLLDPGGDVVGQYTAGRIGDGSSLYRTVSVVLHDSPWFGFGAGGLATAYDNAWVEALCMAGLVGAALYTAVLVVLGVAWARRRAGMDAAAARLAGGLVLVLAGASVGVPALTANRTATVAWLLLTLLLFGLPTAGRAPSRGPTLQAVGHA
jgi:hypothetical protein